MSFRESIPATNDALPTSLDDIRENPGPLFVLPALLLMLALIAYPLIDTVRLSFHELSSGGETFSGISNYVDMVSSQWFWDVLLNTGVWVVVGVTFQILIGFGLALLLHTQFPAKSVVRAGFLLPWVTPTIVTAIVFSWMYDPQFGIINDFLMSTGLIQSGIPWLGDPGTAMIAVLIAAIWKQLPFVMIMVLAGLQGMDESLHSAAKIDGAPFHARLRHVTVPALMPVLKVVILLSVIWMFNQFVLIFIMTGGGPLGSTSVLAVKVYKLAFQEFRYGPATALSVVMILIMISFIYFYIKALRKRGVDL